MENIYAHSLSKDASAASGLILEFKKCKNK
jgi:hypothetical protein